jgi:hypothetical protein
MGSTGGEKELIRPGRDALETHVRSRFDEKSSFLLMIIKQIGEGSPVVDEFVRNMGVASYAIDGRARTEYIEFGTGMIAPETMPLGPGRGYSANGHGRPRLNKPRVADEGD